MATAREGDPEGAQGEEPEAPAAPVPRMYRHTTSSMGRHSRAAVVASVHRSLVTTAGEWYQQTPAYANMVGTYGAIGAPGQDLRRLAAGPTLYVNGTPDKGYKATLSSTVAHAHSGSFGKDLGPGNMMTVLHQAKPNCRRSVIGPDPYDTMLRNDWHMRNRTIAFTAEDGRPRSGEWAMPRASYSHSHADSRRPEWIHRRQSRQVLAPGNRVPEKHHNRVWTPETHRPWPKLLERNVFERNAFVSTR